MHSSLPLSSSFPFRNPCHEPSALPSSSLPFRDVSSPSLSSPTVFREGHGTSELTTPVLVPAQHRQKALVHYCRVKKPISAYFLYDLAAVLKQQVPAISFRSSASLINTGILLLIKLFEEDKPCASTFALMDLTPMLLHLQRHRESKWTMTEPPFWTNNTPISLLIQLNIFTRYLKLIRESITQTAF